MRTRWRAWTTRTAVVAVVTAIATAGIATPAHAAGPKLLNFRLAPSNGTINPGQELKALFTVAMNDLQAGVASYSTTSSKPDKLRCVDGCNAQNMQIAEGGTDVEATFETVGFFSSDEHLTIKVTATSSDGDASPLEANVTIKATPTIPEVSGIVTNTMTGEPIKTASIEMDDSVGEHWTGISTDDDGKFIITKALYGKNIADGFIILTVSKDGYEPYTRQYEANVPKTNLRLTLTQTESTVTATTEAPSITPSGDETLPATTDVAVAPPSQGMSGFSIMLIVVGGLLVLLGIGAIVLLFVRRNNDEYGPPKPGKPGPGGGPGGGRGPQPPGRGGPPGQRRPGGPADRTAPMRPGFGPPRPGTPNRDQTTIARSPLADNPTQHGRRPPGPQPPYSGPPAPPPPGYGPPPPAPPGHGGPPGGYGQQQTYGGPAGGHGTPPPPYGGDPRPGGGRSPGEGRRVDWMDDY